MAGLRTLILAQARLLIVLGHLLIAFPQDSRREERQLLKPRQTRRANKRRLLKRRKNPNRRLKLRMKSLKKKLKQSKKVLRKSNQNPKRPKPKKQQKLYQTKKPRKAQ